MHTMLVLKNRNLLLLIQGHLVSKIGSCVFDIAMVLWLKQQIGLASVVGLVLMLSNFPEILFSPVGGTVADMFPRKTILVVSDLIIGAVISVISGVIYFFPDQTSLIFALIILGSTLIGLCSSFFNPAVSALIPELVPESQLQSANSSYQFSTNLSTFIGQSLGGILFALLGAPLLFLLNGISYLFSAGTETFITLPPSRHQADTAAPHLFTRFIDTLKEGFTYIRQNPALMNFLVILCVYHFFVSPLAVVFPFYVSDSLQKSQAWYGYLLAGFGAGILSGFALAGLVRVSGQKRLRVVLTCLVGVPLLFLTLGLSRNALLALAATFCLGVLIANIVVNLHTIIQISTPKALHGRIFGLYNTLSNASIPIGMGFFGLVLDLLRRLLPKSGAAPASIFLLCGCCLIPIAFLLLRHTGTHQILLYETETREE